jgi:GT2 family glycosyltransferase
MVSMVIVSWNARDYLLRCLASLERYGDGLIAEVIVVDNASADDSVACVRAAFPAVTIVEPGENLGFARGNNLGLRLARGKYLCLLNSDAELLPGCLSTLVAHLEANPRVGLIGPRVEGADGTAQDRPRGFPTLWNMFCFAAGLDALCPRSRWLGGYLRRAWPIDRIMPAEVLSGCFWLARRTAVDEVGGLDESYFMYGEDIDWCRSFHERDWEVVFHPQARAIHHGGKSSGNAPLRFYLEMHRANLQYWRKHHGRLATAGYYLVCLLHHAVRVTAYGVRGVFSRQPDATRRAKIERSWRCLRWLVTLSTRGLHMPVGS